MVWMALMATSFSAEQDEQGVYHFQGELSIHSLDQLNELLESALQSQGQGLSVSLEKVRFVDTAALQLLVMFKKKLEPDVSFRIVGVSPEVEDILSLSGLKPVLI
jgi:anti-anti-sigma factor